MRVRLTAAGRRVLARRRMARSRIRNALRRTIRRGGAVINMRTGNPAGFVGRLRGFRRLRRGIVPTGWGSRLGQGHTTLTRQTTPTVIFNNSSNDAVAIWVNGEPGTGGGTGVPAGYQLWGAIAVGLAPGYYGPGNSVFCSTEVGGSAFGSAGEIVQGRIRPTLADVLQASHLQDWEYIRLDYITVHFQYNRTEYTAGNDANGLIPALQYFFDIDNSFSGTTEVQLTPAQLERRPNMRSKLLYPGKIVSIKMRPYAFNVQVANQNGGFQIGNRSRLGFIDPRSGYFGQFVNNMQFQIRNLQLPGGGPNEQSASFVKVWAHYHFSCKTFIGNGAP